MTSVRLVLDSAGGSLLMRLPATGHPVAGAGTQAQATLYPRHVYHLVRFTPTKTCLLRWLQNATRPKSIDTPSESGHLLILCLGDMTAAS